MLWWFLILGVSLAVVVSVVVSLYVRLRKQMAACESMKAESNGLASGTDHKQDLPPEV